MASSRWKRFAFFERHTLSLSSEVLNDLIPFGDNHHPSLRTHHQLGQKEANNDSVHLVVSTAALPKKLKPTPSSKQADAESRDEKALSEMWSSLNACTIPDVHGTAADDAMDVVHLPSQTQTLSEDNSATMSSGDALDGLVLVFLASRSSDLVHCFDLTVRCNPPQNNADKDLEDFDGWRGYFAPFMDKSKTASTARLSVEDSIVREHMEGEKKPKGVRGIAICRSNRGHRPLHLACITDNDVCVWEDPHLNLSCRRPLTKPRGGSGGMRYGLSSAWNATKDGKPQAVDVAPNVVAVGTDTGAVVVLVYGGSRNSMRPHLTIPPPPAPGMEVVSVKISLGNEKAGVFVAYRRSSDVASTVSAAGICCYEMPLPRPSSSTLSAPSARHDLDGRHVSSSSLCDTISDTEGVLFTVARPDGLYTYSQTQKIGVAPIDGSKLAICFVPPPLPACKAREVSNSDVSSNYVLVASTDSKSDRDAVDIYDATNKLVAFHLLLSPGHRAMHASGVTTPPTRTPDGGSKGGRSSAVVLTSGGSLITLTEKVTSEKVSLLVQKNLYSAAIVVAYADPSYQAADITALYRKHAEYLYRKGDYSAAVDQYIHTIGSLESSHVIFRFLGAPKIPLLVRYLEELRSRELATPVHNELLRTCYLKLNDSESAEAIASSSSNSMDTETISSMLSGLADNPKDALATICSLDAHQAAEALVTHGAALARVLPRETAGLVVSLCVGTYSPKNLAYAAVAAAEEANKMLEYATDDRPKACEPYSIHLFASAFLENPKMLRLILAHCNRNRCPITPSLRRTLLELTLEEWNQAKRSGDGEVEKKRHKEALAALTDSHCREIGDYEALVIVQQAGFDEGELLLYERLQMGPMLLARYAKDGSEKSRRQMLAMCQTDPEILADVLGHFVAIASEKLNETNRDANEAGGDDDDSDDEAEDILEDIRETLSIARRQGVLPPVRIARILAGEGTEQFSANISGQAISRGQRTVPLSVALDYVGAILDESRKEISRLKSEVEEYNQLCNSMETEAAELFRASMGQPPIPSEETKAGAQSLRINIDEMYTKVVTSVEGGDKIENRPDQSREGFWREMEQSEDSFETITRFFSKGVIR